MERILVATDGSEHAEHALELASPTESQKMESF